MLDFAVIGAGMAGAVFLRHARDRGYSVRAFEKAPDIGGLWRDLPDWQDIQSTPADWSTNGLPCDGVMRADIQRNIGAYVDRYRLRDLIKLNTAVVGAEYVASSTKDIHMSLRGGAPPLPASNDRLMSLAGGHWRLTTSSGEVIKAKRLVVATGAHNKPRIPTIEKHDARVEVIHSFNLRDPAQLKGKRVTVLGGGASAYDLLDLALAQGATEIHWVYRNLIWTVPTTGPKHEKIGLRDLAVRQMEGGTPEEISKLFNTVLPKIYKKLGVGEIVPDYTFDFSQHPIIPGRPGMVREFKKLIRHRGTVKAIEGNTVVTDRGDRFETDLLLLGTGYEMDLSYLKLPKLAEVRDPIALQKRCGAYVISLDYPDLYFFTPALLDTNSQAVFMMSAFARSILAHVAGKIQLPRESLPYRIHHWHMIEYLARYDRYNYKPWWRLKYRLLAKLYARYPKLQIRT